MTPRPSAGFQSAQAKMASAMPPERRDLLVWLSLETVYADQKYGEGHHETGSRDHEMTDKSLVWWENAVFSYWQRAKLMGLDTPQGRQALAKCWAAMAGCLEAAQRVHGPLPKPGLPSGEVEEWE